MVVCDVTEESKDVISSLEDANVSNVGVFQYFYEYSRLMFAT